MVGSCSDNTLFYHKQPQKWSLAFVILLARNWTFLSSSAGLPGTVSHTLLSLYGVLQGDEFRCVILSLNTDPSDFWALLRQELAYILLLANGFLIESPQVVYLFTEVIPERWERGADPQRSLLPVLSSHGGNHRNAVSIFPLVFLSFCCRLRLLLCHDFDLIFLVFSFVRKTHVKDLGVLSSHADLIHYSGLCKHIFISQDLVHCGFCESKLTRMMWLMRGILSDSCVFRWFLPLRVWDDQSKRFWGKCDPLLLKVRRDVDLQIQTQHHFVCKSKKMLQIQPPLKANCLQTRAKSALFCFSDCIHQSAVA